MALSKKQREIMNSKKSEDSYTDNVSCSNTRAIRSEITSPKVAKRTGVFSSVCLFCDQGRKRVQGVNQKLVNVETKDFEGKIRKYVEWMEDSKLAAKISGGDFTAKEVKYHACCRVKYQTQAESRFRKNTVHTNSTICQETSYWHKERDVHRRSFDALCSFIKQTVVEEKEVPFLVDVKSYYKRIIRELGGGEMCYPRCKSLRKNIKNTSEKIYV